MAIAFVNGTSGQAVSTTATSISYTPTAGNLVVLAAIFTPSTVTNVSATDSNSVALTAGPSIVNGANQFTKLFYYTAPVSAPTSFQVSWTTTANIGIMLAEYSGVTGGVNPVGVTNTGNSAAPALSLVTTAANDFIVGAWNTSTNTPNSATVGNFREGVFGGNPRGLLLDNTTALSGATVSIVGNVTSGPWSGAGVELRSIQVASGGFSNSLMMVGCGI